MLPQHVPGTTDRNNETHPTRKIYIWDYISTQNIRNSKQERCSIDIKIRSASSWIQEVAVYSLTSDLTSCYVSVATDQAETRRSHMTFDADQQKCHIDNRQLSNTVCSWAPVTLRKCVNVEGRHSWTFQIVSNCKHTVHLRARGGAVGWGTALQVGRSRVWFPMVSMEIFIDIILPAAIWPWGWISL